ncbi:Phosphate transporter PHO1-2 [Triticum urartu]|uniref:Phosphate transporter PHO1-2 n=1 Tax=Triticum urartu TaxID=4572 RepID=M8A467_TRIUA|nr:Phosphate transporter PHO1-2 [Triticum urartu]
MSLFQVILFLLWGLCCCKIGWDSVMRMSVDLRDLFLYEAFLYYNPLLLVALMIWLWGVNLWVFAQSSVNYAKVFDLSQTHLSHREIWRVLLYAILLMILLSPFDMFYLSSRFFFLRTMWRIALPLQAITFPDFFMADIFTSMSKVFSDLERSGCRMVHRQVATIAWFEADSICGSHSVAIPLVLVFYWVLGSNLILRCTWTYKLSAHLRHNYLTVFAITALEMVRRFQWVFFRVENEWNKMTAKQNFELSSDMPPSESDRLLDSNSHKV